VRECFASDEAETGGAEPHIEIRQRISVGKFGSTIAFGEHGPAIGDNRSREVTGVNDVAQ